jgi:hypothetical protein
MECSERKVDYCALVAVTTATDVGVATPTTGAGVGGVTGGGVLPEGGGTEAAGELPPHPLLNMTKAMIIIATNSSRPERATVETCNMSAPPRKRGACPGNRSIGAGLRC